MARLMKSERAGVARIGAATGHSWRGLQACWRNEAAFRLEVVLFAPLAMVACAVQASGVERALLLACLVLVLIVELLNSGIEAAIDRIGTEYHPLSGLAKDLGSAAVTLGLILGVIVWGCILL